jgi:hypothetical protein
VTDRRKWVHLTTASDQLSGEMLVDLLRRDGVAAIIKPSDAVSFLGVSGIGCRILVPSDQLNEARAILAEREEAGGYLQP